MTKRKRPEIRTLRDITGKAPPQQTMPSRTAPSKGSATPSLHPITKLEGADFAQSLLERVLQEFLPIIQRRQYNIRTVSEMCCCGDGLRRARMGANVLGYNQTTTAAGGYKTHAIHLRLRHAQAHQRFMTYESVAGTMAHELAHCERGPHDPKFFAIMDGILEEHATLIASRLDGRWPEMSTHSSSNSSSTSAAFSGTGQRLGGGSGTSRLLGQKLGGTKTRLAPAQAALVAAEKRRREAMRAAAARFCQPCVIEIQDDSDDEVLETTKPVAKQKPPDQQTAAVIDLTSDNEDDRKPPAKWSCRRCTFINAALAQACEMCRSARAR